MKLHDALALAAAIDASGLAQLITIGRFLPLDMLTAEAPWGCAVRQPDGTIQTLWSPADWRDLQRLRGEPTPSEPTALAAGLCEPTALAAGDPSERPTLTPCAPTAIPAGDPDERSLTPDGPPTPRTSNTPAASAVGSQTPRRDAVHLRQPSLF